MSYKFKGTASTRRHDWLGSREHIRYRLDLSVSKEDMEKIGWWHPNQQGDTHFATMPSHNEGYCHLILYKVKETKDMFGNVKSNVPKHVKKLWVQDDNRIRIAPDFGEQYWDQLEPCDKDTQLERLDNGIIKFYYPPRLHPFQGSFLKGPPIMKKRK